MQACYAKTIVRERAKPEDWTPETMLQRAIAAKTATTRAKYARLGLSTEQPLDRTTQSLLLRQLYLSYFESENFEKALEIAEQILALGIMLDVCRQDMARTLLSLGQLDAAVEHLRLAARAAPASRRSFHWWTLGSVLYLAGRLEEAEGALRRAVRWGTTARPLYDAQLALIQLEMGQSVADVDDVVERLEEAPCGQGYGRFALGMLCLRAGFASKGEHYLRLFLKRLHQGRKATALSLSGEIAIAQEQLRRLAG